MKEKTIKSLPAALIAFCLSALSVDAATVSFDCTFATFSDEKTAQQKQNKPLILRYVLDANAQKAYLLGELGSSEVAPVTGTLGITFMEFLPTGAVQTTTVSINSSRATHSRHTLVGKEIWDENFWKKQ